MKTPRFLLGATLLFWGWQTDFLLVGAVLGVALESARWIKARWEVSDDDFSRIWTFCSLLLLAAAVYAFTANNGPGNFSGLFQNPNLHTERNASTSSAKTAAAVIRWLPMIFFLFVAAQAFSPREGIPIETINLLLRRRWKKARDLSRLLPSSRSVDISYPYFAVCLFAASISTGDNSTFFWGLCALLTWALWSQRSRRFGIAIWLGTLALAVALGYYGQYGLGHLQRYFEKFNPQWLSGFSHRGFDLTQTKTALGQIGRLKTSSQIVIRLESKNGSAPPTLLREASYRSYKDNDQAQTWTAGSSKYDFEDLRPETPNGTAYLLLPAKTNTAAVNIACYLHGGQGLLPLPTGSGRLDNLFVIGLQKNGVGTVIAQGPGLVIFDARYGPGATIDSIANTNEDCSVPSRESVALDRVVSELHLSGLSLEEKLRAINGFFQGKFSYSTWQERDRRANTNETPVTRFLLRTRSGHCEYFATATVLLLRELKIPARYAVGYAVHESSGRKFVVRQRDAHAWCLVWNEKKKLWQDFDTTPASWVEAEARLSPLHFIWDAWSRIVFVFEFSKLRWGQTHLRQYILLALVPVLLLLLVQIIFRSRRQRHRRSQGLSPAITPWPGLDSEFYQLEKTLVARDLARGPSETFSNWLFRAAADPALAQLEAPLQRLLRLHYRYRFDPQGLTPADRGQLRFEAQACLARLAARKQFAS